MPKLVRGRYEPLEVVGRGGQGTVVRALDHQHGRLVALKRRGVGGPAARERVLGEARLLLGLAPHPNLVVVRDDFFLGGYYYLVMDWVEGASLQRLLGERGDPGLAFPVVLGYLDQLAAALDHLHGHDPPVVHGDVKPANLVLSARGRLVLVDFGVASLQGQRPTAPGGTPGYAAPELAAGAAPSPAADVYALAATAYALLTGAPPAGEQPRWEGLPPAAAEVIERALRRALSWGPARRPGSAGELVAGLRAWFDTSLPTGTVTFLLTQLAGPARLEDAPAAAVAAALARHTALIAEAVERHGGRLLATKTEGEGRTAVFWRARDAAAAACQLQRSFAGEPWPTPAPLGVRAALHTGEATPRAGEYHGKAVEAGARLRQGAHAGQVLVSRACAELVGEGLPAGASLEDLGTYRLGGRTRPERVFQLCHPDLPVGFPPPRSAAAPAHNLPAQLTSFVGREQEVAAVAARLREPGVRLVSLCGAGGSGKTRLALQAAAGLVGEEWVADGVYFVSLASVAQPSLVAPAVAAALGVKEARGRSLVEALKAYLRDRRLLLVLDNFEQVAAAASLVTELLAAAPQLMVLVTSRMALRCSGEHEYPVATLAVPDSSVPPERLAGYEAVRLFVERARAVKPDFEATDAAAQAVAEICRRLDGLPLALELAAARVRLLSPQALLARLRQRLALLTAGPRDLPARQQTLRATLEWSHALLAAGEQALFARLAVFAGGCTLEAAEAVCNADGDLPVDVLDGIESLVGKSLLRQEEGAGGEPRVGMLETVHEYAGGQLAASGAAATLRRRHARYFLGLAEQAEPRLGGGEQAAWLTRLQAEHDNLRAALAWSLAGEPEVGLRLAGTLWRFWEICGYFTEGREWLEQALAGSGAAPALRAKALTGAGTMAFHQGDYQRATALHGQALLLFRRLGDARGVAFSLNNLGSQAFLQGDLRRATRRYAKALALARKAGDQRLAGYALNNQGELARLAGDYGLAVSLVEESASLFEAVGDQWGSAVARCTLGEAAQRQGDHDQAARELQDALRVFYALGDRWRAAECLGGLALVAAARGQPARAARLFGAAAVLLKAVGAPPYLPEQARYDEGVAAVRARTRPEVFAAAWDQGRAMPLEEAVAEAARVVVR